MKHFNNILVGIDINSDGELASGSQAALAQAFWLAAHNEAFLTFMHVIDLPAPVGAVMSMQPQSPANQRQLQASSLLEDLVVKAEEQGLRANFRVEFGSHWRELIAAVIQRHHDLVIIGTRGRGIVGRTLFGSTGNRLLRYCPCPVWTVKPQDHENYLSVLVAHDLTPVGHAALRIGAELASMQHAKLHILHVLELPEDKKFLGSVTKEELEQRHEQARQQLMHQCQELGVDSSATIEIVEGSAQTAILDNLKQQQIDLMCMGTVARSGLSGLLTGNTAENVLPWVHCSLIAIKPEGFVTPVSASEPTVHHLRSSGRKS
jgi:universal stress protein E